MHSSRWSVFQREATWRLDGDALVREGGEPADAGWFPHAMRTFLRILVPWYVIPIEPGGPARFPFRDIVALRLAFEPTRVDHERHRCDVTMRDGTKVSLWSTHYVSVGEFENRAATYTPLVRELVVHAASANPDCVLRAGKTAFGYWAQLIFLLAMFSLLALVILTFGSGGLSSLVWLKLAIIAGLVPLLIRYARKNRPRRFTPDAIPDDVLPSVGH
jgi:hypothetical protein